jgi:hypothetical protein
MKKLLAVVAVAAALVVFRRQLLRALTRVTGTWVGSEG